MTREHEENTEESCDGAQNDNLVLMPGSQRKGTKEQSFLWEQPWHAENHETSFAAICHHKYFLKLKSVKEAFNMG